MGTADYRTPDEVWKLAAPLPPLDIDRDALLERLNRAVRGNGAAEPPPASAPGRAKSATAKAASNGAAARRPAAARKAARRPAMAAKRARRPAKP